MGYRSDVIFEITADRKNTRLFKEFIGKIKLAHEEFLDEWSPSDYGWGECAFVFSAADVKWYENYPEVQRATAIWQMAKEMDGLSGKFIRIGEEYDDVEVDMFGDFPPDMYVSRSIEEFSGDLLGERRTADAQEQAEQAQAPAQQDIQEPTSI